MKPFAEMLNEAIIRQMSVTRAMKAKEMLKRLEAKAPVLNIKKRG